MGPANSDGITRVPPYSGLHYVDLSFAYRTFTFYGPAVQLVLLARINTTSWSYYPKIALLQLWFGLFPIRSPLLGESLLFSLPTGTKMFQFPAFASLRKK